MKEFFVTLCGFQKFRHFKQGNRIKIEKYFETRSA